MNLFWMRWKKNGLNIWILNEDSTSTNCFDTWCWIHISNFIGNIGEKATFKIQKAYWTFWTILWTWLLRIFHFCDVHYYKRPFLLYFLNVYISQILKGNKEDVPLIRHDVWPSAHRGIPAVCQILSIHLQIFFFRLRNLFSHIFPLGIYDSSSSSLIMQKLKQLSRSTVFVIHLILKFPRF